MNQFGSRPLKAEDHLDFLMCRRCVTYHWKALDEGYNFALDLISIAGLHTKLWDSKVTGLQNYENPNFGNFKILEQNDIWVLALWLGIDNTIRGKVMASPKSGLWWVLWIHVCPWFVHAPKVLQLCINQLIWFV